MSDHTRSLLAITGDDRIAFLQGLLTQDIAKLNDDTIQFAALLSPQGKILHDMFIIHQDKRLLLDSPAIYVDTLRKRLAMYKLRAQVGIEATALRVVYHASAGLADPRHPELPYRLYLDSATANPEGCLTDEQAAAISLALGIPDSTRDFAPDTITAMDAGYDLLHAISFTKGCYVGQEIVARMHYKNIARKGFYRLTGDLAPPRLVLLRFEDVEAHDGRVTVDNLTYQATLPAWLQPKFAQFQQAVQNQ